MTETVNPTARTAPPPERPSFVGGLWKVFATLMVIGAFVSGTYNIASLLGHEQRVETESFPAAGITRVEIESSDGSVRVEASARETIEVRAEISEGLRDTGESREVVGESLRLRSTCPNFGSDFCWVDYVVLVPLDVELLVSGGDGSIDIIGSAAPITADADNGSVELTAVSGPFRVSSDNGRVEGTQLGSSIVTADADNGSVLLEFTTAPRTVVATSDNGGVEVVVPDDEATYRIDVQSDNGSETVEVPVDSSSSRTITARSDNGSVAARTADR